MISSITANNVNFKNTALGNKNVSYELQRKNNKEPVKIETIGAVVGLGTGIGAKLLKKDTNTSLKYGIGAYFTSLLLLYFLKGLLNISDSKFAYKQYEKEEKYKNKFDEFISRISTPEKIDFGNEEKNKQYYKIAKKERMETNKINLAAIATGIITAVAAGIICQYKKVPNKIDKISTLSLIATTGALLLGNAVSIFKKTKEQQNS